MYWRWYSLQRVQCLLSLLGLAFKPVDVHSQGIWSNCHHIWVPKEPCSFNVLLSKQQSITKRKKKCKEKQAGGRHALMLANTPKITVSDQLSWNHKTSHTSFSSKLLRFSPTSEKGKTGQKLIHRHTLKFLFFASYTFPFENVKRNLNIWRCLLCAVHLQWLPTV